ncbi:MAG: SEC-C metal-binding domain-containing protein [Actinomycetota bacterium]|nr:SEC-C metal-binding domain-containing protein [Actinomycetota bacterium]
MPIEAKTVTNAIERAQSQVESRNFEIRKNLLKYDEVLNKQREVIYGERRQLLEAEVKDPTSSSVEAEEEEESGTLSEKAPEFIAEAVESVVGAYLSPEVHSEDWDWDSFETAMTQLYPTKLNGTFDRVAASYDAVLEAYMEEAISFYNKREEEFGEQRWHEIERLVFLDVLDNKWREHLYEMDHLREGVGLRAYGQRDPLIEYQREAYAMFQGLQQSVKEDFVRYMFHVQAPQREEETQDRRLRLVAETGDTALSEAKQSAGEPVAEGVFQQTAKSDKVPRNAPCPCGSGKKYKKCHGAEV